MAETLFATSLSSSLRRLVVSELLSLTNSVRYSKKPAVVLVESPRDDNALNSSTMRIELRGAV